MRLAGSPDMVLDCIDDVATKVDLIAECRRRGLRVIASMGAGAKVRACSTLAGASSPLARPYCRALRPGTCLPLPASLCPPCRLTPRSCASARSRT